MKDLVVVVHHLFSSSDSSGSFSFWFTILSWIRLFSIFFFLFVHYSIHQFVKSWFLAPISLGWVSLMWVQKQMMYLDVGVVVQGFDC